MSRLIVLASLVLFALAGCAATFDARRAMEISRDELLRLSEKEKSEHLYYMGSDPKFHYVFDTRQGKADSYKVRADKMPLRDTFRMNDDFEEPYVLLPWVIEGKPLGRKPE